MYFNHRCPSISHGCAVCPSHISLVKRYCVTDNPFELSVCRAGGGEEGRRGGADGGDAQEPRPDAGAAGQAGRHHRNALRIHRGTYSLKPSFLYSPHQVMNAIAALTPLI